MDPLLIAFGLGVAVLGLAAASGAGSPSESSPTAPRLPRDPGRTGSPGAKIYGPKGNYALITGGKALGPHQMVFLSQLMKRVPFSFGISSGTRTATSQANAMNANERSGQNLSAIYRTAAGREVIAAAPSDRARVIQAQMDRGVFVSDHLHEGALDVSVNHPALSSSQVSALVAASKALGADAQHEVVSASSSHVHIEDLPDLDTYGDAGVSTDASADADTSAREASRSRPSTKSTELVWKVMRAIEAQQQAITKLIPAVDAATRRVFENIRQVGDDEWDVLNWVVPEQDEAGIVNGIAGHLRDLERVGDPVRRVGAAEFRILTLVKDALGSCEREPRDAALCRDLRRIHDERSKHVVLLSRLDRKRSSVAEG